MSYDELGTHLNVPYLSNLYYETDEYQAEIPKYVFFADVFPRIRNITDFVPGTDTYPNTNSITAHEWITALLSHNSSCYIFYGVACNPYFKPRYWDDIVGYVSSEAQWAQDNGVSMFCAANENLISGIHGTTHGMQATSLTRSSNVTTVVFAFDHGFTTGDYIFVYGANESSFNVADSESSETVQCTVVNSTTITYPNTGTDGSATGTVYVDWSGLEVARKTKELVEVAQTYFTNGPVAFSSSQGHSTAYIAVGIAANSKIGFNGYGNGDNESAFNYWKSELDTMYAEFGSSMFISEFNVVQEAPDTRKVLNAVQTSLVFDERASEEVYRRYTYAKDLGIDQIYLFGPWGNGITFWMAFNVFCNISTYGWNDSTQRQIVGKLMPFIDRLQGKRLSRVFFGNCINT